MEFLVDVRHALFNSPEAHAQLRYDFLCLSAAENVQQDVLRCISKWK